jgi:hypothetical protein
MAKGYVVVQYQQNRPSHSRCLTTYMLSTHAQREQAGLILYVGCTGQPGDGQILVS